MAAQRCRILDKVSHLDNLSQDRMRDLDSGCAMAARLRQQYSLRMSATLLLYDILTPPFATYIMPPLRVCCPTAHGSCQRQVKRHAAGSLSVVHIFEGLSDA